MTSFSEQLLVTDILQRNTSSVIAGELIFRAGTHCLIRHVVAVSDTIALSLTGYGLTISTFKHVSIITGGTITAVITSKTRVSGEQI